jgi:formamidopyrimidine-DNA glycosylase
LLFAIYHQPLAKRVPELSDVLAYCSAIRKRVAGLPVESVRIYSPFVLRTFEPPIEDAVGRTVCDVGRLGKRIVLALDGERYLVVHLMIAGRFRCVEATGALNSRRAGVTSDLPKSLVRIALATVTFPGSLLALVESGTTKRAGIHYLAGRDALAALHTPGVDARTCSPAEFAEALRRENHTLKRCLTGPGLFDGIGNAYSDEILHAARLSPVLLSQKLDDEQCARLHAAARSTLDFWIQRLQAEFADRFPGAGDITAFRPEFAVHGKFGQPCPVCGKPVQRIRYADNETNYCAVCQTGGKVLADRSLSRLLKDDWPRTLE